MKGIVWHVSSPKMARKTVRYLAGPVRLEQLARGLDRASVAHLEQHVTRAAEEYAGYRRIAIRGKRNRVGIVERFRVFDMRCSPRMFIATIQAGNLEMAGQAESFLQSLESRIYQPTRVQIVTTFRRPQRQQRKRLWQENIDALLFSALLPEPFLLLPI